MKQAAKTTTHLQQAATNYYNKLAEAGSAAGVFYTAVDNVYVAVISSASAIVCFTACTSAQALGMGRPPLQAHLTWWERISLSVITSASQMAGPFCCVFTGTLFLIPFLFHFPLFFFFADVRGDCTYFTSRAMKATDSSAEMAKLGHGLRAMTACARTLHEMQQEHLRALREYVVSHQPASHQPARLPKSRVALSRASGECYRCAAPALLPGGYADMRGFVFAGNNQSKGTLLTRCKQTRIATNGI